MRNTTPIGTAALLLLLGLGTAALAQDPNGRTKYWIGGSGTWDDAARWSLVPGGAGGAGVPRINEHVVIDIQAAATITMPDVAWCRGLHVVAQHASLQLIGSMGQEVNIAGHWSMSGDVRWDHRGDVRLVVRNAGVDLDLRGIPIASRLVFDGSGSWSMLSDLVLDGDREILLRHGTLMANGNLLKADRIEMEGRQPKRLIGGDAVILLEQVPDMAALRGLVEPGNSTLVINGMALEWDQPGVASSGGQRDVNVCGTGPGQTPFTVDAQVISNYNGFGVRCRGECNATVNVAVNGGIGPFTYQWLNGGPNTATWITACGGPQIVIVTDVGQGISCPVSVNVSEPAPLGVIFFGAGTPPTCADVCNGSRTALAVGGVNPISYNWNNGAGTNSAFFELCAGLNTLVITDDNGCQLDTTFFFDLQPLEPNLSFTTTTCFGACDGTASVSPSGGTLPHTVTWTPAPPVGQGTNNVSGLCAGPWSVTIEDANGCDTTVQFIIDEPLPITIDLVSTDATCFGTCDGTATVDPGGTPGQFGFNWSPEPGAGQGTASVTGLCEDTYFVTITDLVTGCDTLVAVPIDAPGAFDVAAVVADASCAKVCDGSITPTPGGGTLPYTFVWSPEPASGQGTATVTDLCPGIWTLLLTDAAGCDTTIAYTIGAPPPLDPALTTTPVSCAGDCDGTASVSVTGGVPPYTYLWSPAPGSGQGTDNVQGLCAGAYTLLVTDDNGCDTTLNFIIDEPPPLEAIPSQTDVTCGGLCDGTATVAVSGGTPDYTYAWSDGQATATATALCPGVHSVLITDDAGCVLVVDFTIDDPGDILLSLQVLPASCPNVCDGSAGVIASGGTPPFTYVWAPEPGAGQGTPNVSALCPGPYLLTVTDAAGCDTTIAFTVDAPDPIEANATVTNATCSDLCNGSIVLAPTGGNGVFTYLWSPAPPVGQGTTSVSGLCPGIWEVTITSGACDSTFTFEITAPPPIDVQISTTDPTCAGLCDGTASATVLGGTPGYDYVWSPEPAVGQGLPDASGLCPGIYTLTVIDDLGCDTTLTFELLTPVQIEFDLTLTEAGCDLLCAGTATLNVTAGNGPFTYIWGPEPVTGQGTTVASELCTGFHTLTIIDAAGCDTTTQFFIAAPSDIEAIPSVTNVSCGGDCDGAISVATSAGIPPYTYVWTPEPAFGQGTPNVSGLCAGIWELRIVDAVACDTVLQILVTEPPPIVPVGVSTDESCNGPCDGTATVTPSGGEPPYTYFWTPTPVGQGTPQATDLCPGIWSVLITDDAGCDTTVVFTILPVQPIDAALVVQDPPCADVCEGTAEVDPTGGVGPYTFVWIPPPPLGQGTSVVSGLCPGVWQVLITDAVGCDTTIVFDIVAPPPFAVTLTTTPEDCTTPCSGTASVDASGGTGTILIQWLPEPIGGGQGTATATGLCAGTSYTVTLTDDNGCDTTLAFTIDPFVDIIPNSSSTPVSCAGECDGTATVGPVGGQAPYTYQWSPEPGGGQGTPQATGLCAGVVEVTITDADSCQTVASILILAPDPLDAGATSTDVSCNGACDGSIVLSPQGGTAPFLYGWSPIPPNGQGSNGAFGLCAGDWSVTIIDANGCDTTIVITITEPPLLTVSTSSTPSECLVCVGTGTVVVDGGTTPLNIVWTDALGNVVANGENAVDLCAGLYTVSVTDANGCAEQVQVAVTDADGEVISTTDGSASCPNSCDGTVSVDFVCSDPPCTVIWADANGVEIVQDVTTVDDLCAGEYFVTVSNASGCLTINTAEVIAPPPVQVNISSSAESCGNACNGTATIGIAGGVPPFSFTWTPEPGSGQGTPFATGLCAGVYTITIGDGSACDTAATVLILGPDPLAVSATVLDIVCNGSCDGSIIIAPQGGTAPYTYVWDPVPPNGQGSNGAFDLCAGENTVIVTDANGCIVNGTYTVVEPDPLQVTVNTTQSSCALCDGTGTTSVSGGVAPYTFIWALSGVPVSTDQSPVGLCSGLYQLTVSDVNGCAVQLSVPISDSDAEVLTALDGQASCANDCDGTVGVDLVCSAPPCVAQWTDALGDPIAQDVLIVPDLCPGDYTVQITNANGCISFATASVVPTQIITPNLSSTQVSCGGACDGTATVGPVGGVAPYDFTWSPEPGGGQGTPQATGLCAGVYGVLIADASGCDTLITVLILEPQPLSINATVQDVTCADACTGIVVATPLGGVGPYTYAWDPVPSNGQGSNGAFDLCAGDISLVVTDANGCTASGSWTIGGPPPITLVGTSTPSACGICDGAVTVNASGGTPNYNIYWTLAGAIIGTGSGLSDLCAGLYTAVVVDANGCEAMLLVPVTDSDGEVTSTTDGVVTCPGDCDGSVSVDFLCSDPPCTVSWTDADGNDLNETGNVLTDLCEGTYHVLVVNATGCLTIDTAFVLAPDPIVANLSTTPVSCFGVCDGTATVGPTGGGGGYVYLWEPGPIVGQGTPQATDLCAGPYSVTITDLDGCSIVQGVLILGPDQLATDALVVDPTCSGSCDGTIVLSTQGGVGPYTYFWDPVPPNGQGSNGAFDLCAAAWTVTITDDNGCDTTLVYILDGPPALDAPIQTTDNDCFGGCQGTALVTLSGGTPPYTTVWSDDLGNIVGQDVNDVDSLCAGSYLLSVTDDTGCLLDVPFSIGEEAPIDVGLLFTSETCFGPCDGTASVSPAGGAGNFQVVWSPEPPFGQGTTQATGLCAVMWEVTVTDQTGCDSTQVFMIPPYVEIADNATVQDILCNGDCSGSVTLAATGGVGSLTYVWVPEPPGGQGGPQATDLCPGSIEVTITDAAGCDSTFSYTITEPDTLTIQVDQVVDASCSDASDGSISITVGGGVPLLDLAWSGPDGFISDQEDLADLGPGDYTLIVTDANGCSISTTVLVDALVSVVADAGFDQEVCTGVAVVLDGSASTGGVDHTWTDDQGTVVGTDVVVDLGVIGPGTYTYTLTVTDGPCSSMDQVTVVVLALPIADAGPDHIIFLSETAPLGGSPTGPFGAIFTWSPDSLLNDGVVANPIADPMQTTWFTVTVVAPDGCISTDSALVTVVPDVVIPSGFTPNGDGWNDTWIIDFIELFPDCEVEIYNRWGEMLFQSVGYRQPWDGRYSGGLVPVGTYYYVVKLNDPEFPEPLTGPLTVIR